ncbi:MAG: adenylate/guanylate cyclase domain-containing protein [Gammaproteobacteria bacterium]|nr:MAG: adenylate/guanylate cyclase domain-containing protein [Gammaproteobacteria bacterium]
MEKDQLSRKLAVILHADVVGSTVLVQQNETIAHERIQAVFNHLSETIKSYGGVTIELRGDALVAEFKRASDSVAAALAFQVLNSEVDSSFDDDIRPRLRIGISLGEVIIADNAITGAGVVLAQRLEQLADPGGIVVQGTVSETVPARMPFEFQSLGEHILKGFDQPVRAFVVRLRSGEELPTPEVNANTSPQAIKSKALQVPDKPSIAVLPFENMSGDPEQEFFADGISEDLITALSKIHWFFVIARHSSFTYKGQAVDVTRVASDLGVRYVIEGSVRNAGDRVRISAQLIDATTGHHVWAESYNRSLTDIFELQDEMTQTIAGAVEPELSAAERERAACTPPESLGAWEFYQRGLWHLWSFTKNDMAEARRLFEQVHQLDANFAAAYSFESYSHYLDTMLAFTETPNESLELAYQAARKALALDDKDPSAYFALGRVCMLQGKHDDSVAELSKAVELSPSFALAHHGLGFALVLSGLIEEGAEELDKAIRLSPRDPVMWGTMCFRSIASNLLHDYKEAVEWARKVLIEPRAAEGGYWPYAVLASALGNLNQIPEAREAMNEALQRKPDLSLTYLKTTLIPKQPNGLETYFDGLRKAGLTD